MQQFEIENIFYEGSDRTATVVPFLGQESERHEFLVVLVDVAPLGYFICTQGKWENEPLLSSGFRPSTDLVNTVISRIIKYCREQNVPL